MKLHMRAIALGLAVVLAQPGTSAQDFGGGLDTDVKPLTPDQLQALASGLSAAGGQFTLAGDQIEGKTIVTIPTTSPFNNLDGAASLCNGFIFLNSRLFPKKPTAKGAAELFATIKHEINHFEVHQLWAAAWGCLNLDGTIDTACLEAGLKCHFDANRGDVPCNELWAHSQTLDNLCQELCKARSGMSTASVPGLINAFNTEKTYCAGAEAACAATQLNCPNYPISWPGGVAPDCANFECEYINLNEPVDPADDCGCPP